MLLALLLMGGVWLNGPGLRWIAPQIAAHYLEKSGLRGSFKLSGSLTGGLSVSALHLSGDRGLAGLTVDKLVPAYQLGRLLKGKIDGLTIDGLHVDLRLGLKNEIAPASPPLDLGELVETIRSVRSQVVPLALDLKNLSLSATRDGKPALNLASTSLSHPSGSGEIAVEIGAFTDPTGKQWPAQRTTLLWQPDDLTIKRLDPYPGIGLRDFVMHLPASGGPSLETQVLVDDAVFAITSNSGFASAKVALRSGKIPVAEVAKRFGVVIPATATVNALAITLENIMPDPTAAVGTVRIALTELAWQDWKAPALDVDAALTGDGATIAAHGTLLGSAFSLDAAAPITRAGNHFKLGTAEGKFNFADLPKLLHELAARFPEIDPAAPVPPVAVDGNFSIPFRENQPLSATASVVLNPHDMKLATPIKLNARWAPDEPVSADLTLDGLTAAATYQQQSATYQAKLALSEFTSRRLDSWLAIVRVKPGGIADLSGKWSGGGELKTGRHHGTFELTKATWSREAMVPVSATGGIHYDWPGSFETQDLRVRMNDQSVALEAALANGMLELRRFLWTDGAVELATGTASLPVPADFAKWRDTLAKDTRSLALAIDSRVLSLGLLKQWVPALEKLDPRSTGQLAIQISGTYAEPTVQAKLEAKDLRSPTQPKLPPADLKIELSGRDGRLTLDGSATAPDFPPAILKAAMPFRPAVWAETPAAVQAEAITARVDLPRLDLSRFSSLVPMAEQVSGVLTGNVVVSGKIDKPEFKGRIELNAAGLRFKNDRYPAIQGVSAAVDLTLDRVTLKNLKSTVAGGTLTGDGSLAITDGKLGVIDLRLRGDHLPLVRNDFLILRANADLRLLGPCERAALSGTVASVDSIFYRDIELLPIGTPFTGPAAAALPKIDAPKNQTSALPEPFRNWALDLTVRTAEPFLIRGNLATGEVSGNIKIGGTLGNPAPDGVVQIRDFAAALPFSTLSVRAGTVSFTPATGFDPILEIHGTAEPRPYQIGVYVYGRASNPQLVLTSNPPLPENEIMTLLATGTTTSGLEDPQAASSRALQLLAEELRRGRFRFGKQLRPLLGLLDRVDFSLAEADPYSSDSYSTATLKISDRWFLSAGVSATGDSRALAIWRISFH